jgi:nicotinamide-nucleotide amidase
MPHNKDSPPNTAKDTESAMGKSAELICVGTELLLGDILNSNAQYLAQELAGLGIPHFFQTVVGDNPSRIQQVVAMACERSGLILFTGGLGPTPDDLTIETLADFFDAPLVERPEIVADIEAKFTSRGRVMTPSNRKQALLPKGAEVLPNRTGTAPGIIWEPRPGLLIMTFPGVPSEMKAMWQETSVPYLKTHGWVQDTIVSRMVRCWGIGESGMAERVSEYLNLSNPTVAPYASHGEAKLRISAKAPTIAEAVALIHPVEQGIRNLLGSDCYGVDGDSLASVVGDLLQQKQQTVAVAESCTGGGLGQMFTAVAGSSAYFLGGIIAYDNRIKTNLLKVDPTVLDQEGAVSAIVAEHMALGVKAALQTDWALSITGIAGPGGGSETKPVGLVYIGLALPTGDVISQKYEFAHFRGRDWVRHLSACTALDLLRRHLL